MEKAFIILIIILSLGLITEAIGYIKCNIYLRAIADAILMMCGAFFLVLFLLIILNLAL